MRNRLEAKEGYFNVITGPAANQSKPTAGNTYYVLKSSATNYKLYEAKYQGTYDDKSKRLHNTIDAAINACTTGRGDKIYVLEGHTETVSAAAGIDADKIGITIEGCGYGANKPTITFATATTADMDIDAASVTVRNLRFVGGIASLAAPIDVNAANFTMENCEFYASAATTGVLITVITDAAANDMTIKNCTFNYLTATDGTTAVTETSTEAIRLVGADRAHIEGCYFAGDFTTAAINAVTTACKDIRILNNVVNNIATENIAGGIDLVAESTGFIDGNYCYVAYSSGITFIDASSCVIGYNNYTCNAASETPTRFGTADAASIDAKVASAASDLVVLQASQDSDMVVLKAIINTIASDLVALKAKYASDVP